MSTKNELALNDANVTDYVDVTAPTKGTAQREKLVTCFGVSKHPKDTIGYQVRYSCGETATARASHLESKQCNHTEVCLYQLSAPATQLVAAHVLLNDVDYLSDSRARKPFTELHQNALKAFIAKHQESDIKNAIELAKAIKIAGR